MDLNNNFQMHEIINCSKSLIDFNGELRNAPLFQNVIYCYFIDNALVMYKL